MADGKKNNQVGKLPTEQDYLDGMQPGFMQFTPPDEAEITAKMAEIQAEQSPSPPTTDPNYQPLPDSAFVQTNETKAQAAARLEALERQYDADRLARLEAESNRGAQTRTLPPQPTIEASDSPSGVQYSALPSSPIKEGPKVKLAPESPYQPLSDDLLRDLETKYDSRRQQIYTPGGDQTADLGHDQQVMAGFNSQPESNYGTIPVRKDTQQTIPGAFDNYEFTQPEPEKQTGFNFRKLLTGVAMAVVGIAVVAVGSAVVAATMGVAAIPIAGAALAGASTATLAVTGSVAGLTVLGGAATTYVGAENLASSMPGKNNDIDLSQQTQPLINRDESVYASFTPEMIQQKSRGHEYGTVPNAIHQSTPVEYGELPNSPEVRGDIDAAMQQSQGAIADLASGATTSSQQAQQTTQTHVERYTQQQGNNSAHTR